MQGEKLHKMFSINVQQNIDDFYFLIQDIINFPGRVAHIIQREKRELSMRKKVIPAEHKYLHYAAYVAAIALLIALAVYGLMEQSRFADAVVESFIE